MRKITAWLSIIFVIVSRFSFVFNEEIEAISSESTDLAYEKDDRLLVFATLEGTLIAIEQQTGRILWKIRDKPIVQVPIDTTNAIVPIFLPDPKDGSLYLLGSSKEPLKKLPFTVPQLVASSPCRSSDGILYTGKKKDSWFKLDPRTGNRHQILGWDTSSPTCPILPENSIYIGRTKYKILMVDSHNSNRKWNVTYYDYTSTRMTKEQLNNYEFAHFASSSTGRLVTMDRVRGNILWDGDLGSPVVAAFILDSNGLLSAPFTSLANHTLTFLTNKLIHHADGSNNQPDRMQLYPTLYIGDHLYGLYALPSLVDQNSVTITASDSGPLLLGGPNAPELPKPYPEYPIPGYNYQLPPGDSLTFQSVPNLGNSLIIYIGHYNVPKFAKTQFFLPENPNKPLNLITDESKKSVGMQTDSLTQPPIDVPKLKSLRAIFREMKTFINQQENKGLKITLIILFGCVIAMFWYLQMQVREFQILSQQNSKSSQAIGATGGAVTAYSEDLPDGLVRVGKITFHPEELLGKGCEGTFVYRGEFDNRKVAVKRLLPECFTFADREVALLRESDAHPHVVRYYCTEQDRMFRYIALELCQATLSDYVQGHCDTSAIKSLDILRQATSGLAHLHSLDIVHRDIKPHNVLLSMPDARGQVKAMISDFGLCKKLQVGRVSFSRRSGVTGTDGWIAPEMLSGEERTTYAVDLFSLGCLYYYVLSKGCHPFGDALRRQANILSGDWDLSELKGEQWENCLQKDLLAALISSKSADRPSCNAVLTHPMFWDSSKILAFFQDVSDRVELADNSDLVLQALEENNLNIVKYDWRLHIHEEVAKDLRKYRSYRGQSVRDLLRALRNKKHHFRELTKEAQEYLGEIPNSFTHYWVSRFPLLFIHTYIAMQVVSNETAFRAYYDKNYLYSSKICYNHMMEFIAQNPINFDDLKERSWKLDEGTDGFISLSPRKIGVKKNKWREDIEMKRENVGLYRNLGVSGEVKLQRRFGRKNNKSATKSDEPLNWAVKDFN